MQTQDTKAAFDAMREALEELATAAERREITMGSQCNLIEAKANLESAVEKAKAALALAKG